MSCCGQQRQISNMATLRWLGLLSILVLILITFCEGDDYNHRVSQRKTIEKKIISFIHLRNNSESGDFMGVYYTSTRRTRRFHYGLIRSALTIILRFFFEAMQNCPPIY